MQMILGRWIFALQFRRPAMAVLSRSWDYVTKPAERWKSWDRLCTEVTQLVLLTPLLQADLRTSFSDVATCSDASETGGAVAIARELTPSGHGLASSLNSSQEAISAPILVISCFNGIGGAFRCYDLNSIKPEGLVSIEIESSARRVVRVTWPQALEVSDINLVNLAMVKEWANAYPRVEQVHVWGGFPCVHLSSARAGRLNLQGEGSNLFFKLVEVIRLVEEVFGDWAVVEYVIENVFSMDVSARDQISTSLAIKPLKVDPADCSPMSRPRLAWVSCEVQATPGVTLVDHEGYTEVIMEGEFPPVDAWVRPGWKPTTEDNIYPTFMKAIRRWTPPERPAGLSRCDDRCLLRWESDEFRFPPYQYKHQHLLISESGDLRYLGVDERELLMGMGSESTRFCFSASSQKSHPVDYWDRRFSLLGDGFAALSFAWVAGQLVHSWRIPITPQQIIDRFGLAPGFSVAPNVKVPLSRFPSFGDASRPSSVSELTGFISRQVAQNGADVSIALGTPFCSKGAGHSSLRAFWWEWKILYSTHWHFGAHINSLEMRMILQTAHWRVRDPSEFSKRWLHLADSMVCNFILSKGRTSSHLLQPLVRKLSAVLLAANAIPLYAHVDSAENPTDAASRD